MTAMLLKQLHAPPALTERRYRTFAEISVIGCMKPGSPAELPPDLCAGITEIINNASTEDVAIQAIVAPRRGRLLRY